MVDPGSEAFKYAGGIPIPALLQRPPARPALREPNKVPPPPQIHSSSMAATALLALTSPSAAAAAGGLATHRGPLPARMFSNALSINKTRTPAKRVNVATRATAWPDVASWEKPPGLRMLPDRTDGASRPPVSAPLGRPSHPRHFSTQLHLRAFLLDRVPYLYPPRLHLQPKRAGISRSAAFGPPPPGLA